MRPLVVAALTALLSLPVAADEWQALMDKLRDMMPVDHVGARAGYALYDCVMDAARSLGSRPEPTIQDADWAPTKDRPSLEQLAITAMSSCAEVEAKAAGVLPEPELVAIKKSVLAIAADEIRWERTKRMQLRRE
jgi:hypothetical protein